MRPEELERRIVERGRQLFASISGQKPSLFDKGRWIGAATDWCMRNEGFKTQLFRFVDVFPYLTTRESLTRHVREYFGASDEEVPAVLKWAARGSALGGALGAGILDRAIRTNIQEMGKQFIVGEKTADAVANINTLRQQGFSCVASALGEATVSEEEAERYVAACVGLIQGLGQAQQQWDALPGEQTGGPNSPGTPRIHVSVKPTALYSQARPADFEGTVRSIARRAARIYGKVMEVGGFLCIDMESHEYKDITLEVYRRLRSDPGFSHYPHLGVVLQAYLRESDRDLADLLAWAREAALPISVRLTKGAYWDYEVVTARQHGWPIPVYTRKPETDAAFERQARMILGNHRICHLACASHNVRSIAAVLETARALDVPDERYEFQLLYGMAEPVRRGILDVAERVRLYAPYGELVPGMAYLVRRLLENTSNESFLRQSFAEARDIEDLLEDPCARLERESAESTSAGRGAAMLGGFQNEPAADFTQREVRSAFPRSIAEVRRRLGKTYALFIDGREVTTDDVLPSVNPADPSEVIGRVCQAGTDEVELAVTAATKAFPKWRDTPAAERAAVLRRAAEAARGRLFELAAWQVLEVGKQWDQAHADVAEAIDFLEYYAREAVRLSQPRRLGLAPGELNQAVYEPKGVAAVIAPWNFPLAISCGMASAALATGNCVVYKPSGLSSVIGHQLVEILSEGGVPGGVFNYTPGRGSVIGDFLVDHPQVSLIAFTGSVEVGLRIIERAAKVHPGQAHVKKVVCEMGGKNAIIIDDDADLDEAVPGVLYSAFGFQGQKCSACSRVIVLDAICDRFVDRLVKAAASMKIGPAEDPENVMGPVVDASAQAGIREYIELAKREGEIIYESDIPADGGYYVPMTIVAGITPEHRIAQEEIFGPVLAVMRVRDFDEALDWANSTRFALTGGVFSRSPEHLARAEERFRVGNLYLNRQITGALVGRQPFGGGRMSGVGTKAGGPDYLLHFMHPRTITENTMRRGFAPVGEDDEWVV